MKNLLILLAFSVVMLSSCQQEPIVPTIDPDPMDEPAAPKFLMGFTYEGGTSHPVSIKYDEKGRTTWMDGGEDVYTVTYNGSEISIVAWRTEANKEVFNFKGKLNAAGNLVEGAAIENYSAITYQVKYSFEYNAEGYMTRKYRDANDGALVYDYRYTYKNGNMTEFKAYKNGEYDYGGAWEYDAELLDRSGFSWELFSPYNNFTGKSNRNLAVKYTGKRPNGSSWYVDFSYEMAPSGYPETSTSKYSNGNSYKIFYDFQ